MGDDFDDYGSLALIVQLLAARPLTNHSGHCTGCGDLVGDRPDPSHPRHHRTPCAKLLADDWIRLHASSAS